MKKLILIFVYLLITGSAFAQSSHNQLTSEDVVWIVDTIWELEYDIEEEDHVAKYVSDVYAKLTFSVMPEDRTKALLKINIGNYEKLDIYSYYRSGKPLPEDIKVEEYYEIVLVELELYENEVIYWSENKNDKFIVYMNDEGYMSDAWHFSEFDEELDVYTVSRYFSVPF